MTDRALVATLPPGKWTGWVLLPAGGAGGVGARGSCGTTGHSRAIDLAPSLFRLCD